MWFMDSLAPRLFVACTIWFLSSYIYSFIPKRFVASMIWFQASLIFRLFVHCSYHNNIMVPGYKRPGNAASSGLEGKDTSVQCS